MENNLKKHLLLKKLAEKLILYETEKEIIDAKNIGLTLEEISKILNTSNNKQKLVLLGLQTANEIEPFYANSDKRLGYFITDNIGIDAFNNKKYRKKNWDIILKWIRNFVQLFIPIASLTIAILVFNLNTKKEKIKRIKEIDSLKTRIEILEKSITKNSLNRAESVSVPTTISK